MMRASSSPARFLTAEADAGAAPVHRAVARARIGAKRAANDPTRSPAWVVSLVGHELRMPLATALVYLAVAEKRVSARDGRTSALTALLIAREQIHGMQQRIAYVTEIHELGRASLCPKPCDLGKVVSASVRRMLIGEARSLVVIEPAHGLLGWWDETAVEEIVQNLVSNALKFGGGRPVHVTIDRNGAEVQLTVRDSGPGIDAADLDRIFDRGVHAPRERAGGLGIGLWLVRKLAEAHGGRASVRSRPGGGSTFRVLLRPLPATRDDRVAVAHP